VPDQNVINLVVARHWLFLTGGGIEINIVAASVPLKDASLLLQHPDKLVAFQTAISFVL
jgi:hypothetical protein